MLRALFPAFFFCSHLPIFALLFLLRPTSDLKNRDSDPASDNGFFSPLAGTVRALHFYGEKDPFFNQSAFSSLPS